MLLPKRWGKERSEARPIARLLGRPLMRRLGNSPDDARKQFKGVQHANLVRAIIYARRVGNRDSIFELGIATAAPGMNPLSALAPHPGEQLQKQRPADAPGGVEQPPDREQPSHVRRQSSGFERHDDEHVDEGQRYAADDGRSHPIACPGEKARHDEEEDDPPYAAPE